MADNLNPTTQSIPSGGGLRGEVERQAEAGRPLPDPPTPLPPGMGAPPPNAGVWAVPSFQSFAAVWNTISRTYRWTFDEALLDSRENALAYYKDVVVQGALNGRSRPVCALDWHIEPRKEQDQAQVDHAQRVRDAIEETHKLQQMLFYLNKGGCWFGRYGSRLVYDWDWEDGYRRAIVREHTPINGDKLVFRFSGELGILVGTQYRGSWLPTDRGRAHIFDASERQTVICHQFEPDDADFFEGELAGRVMGVGVRDTLYWFLFLKTRVLAWLMEFLERVGAGGLTIYYYESGDPASLAEVQQAAEKQKTNTAILFPRYSDGKVGPGVDRLDPSMAGADMLYRLVTEYFDNIVRMYILGQSLSSSTGSTGMGSGVADLHADTLNKIIAYDAVNLAETLTRDFVSTISRHIDPGQRVPRWRFDVDKTQSEEKLAAAQAFFEMGGDIDEDDLRGDLGLRKPSPGAPLLSRYGPGGSAMAQLMGQLQPGANPTQVPGNMNPGEPVANPLTNGQSGQDMGIPDRMNVILQALMAGNGRG